jgi:hypothetical protein
MAQEAMVIPPDDSGHEPFELPAAEDLDVPLKSFIPRIEGGLSEPPGGGGASGEPEANEGCEIPSDLLARAIADSLPDGVDDSETDEGDGESGQES